MVTPEDIARAMAVHSVEEEPRRTRDDETASQVLVDNERVQPQDSSDSPDSSEG